MSRGIVFDIKEFTLDDGPGIRTTVFMKGCPLACSWCHNPEGQSIRPQVIRGLSGERISGKETTSAELAERLNKQATFLCASDGGITFSGGEPVLQSEFVADVIDRLDNIHILLDTSGYASDQDFRRVVERSDQVYYDLKLIDRDAHRHYTGCDNNLILNNLQVLSELGVPFVIRVPLVPGVTDTDENLAAIARIVRGLPGLQQVDLLPYNRAAGAKYRFAGMEFKPGYDESRELNLKTAPFERAGVKVRVA